MGTMWCTPTGIRKTLYREWEDGSRFSMLEIVSNFFNCCDRPFMVQVWTEQVNLGEKRENGAMRKPTGIRYGALTQCWASAQEPGPSSNSPNLVTNPSECDFQAHFRDMKTEA